MRNSSIGLASRLLAMGAAMGVMATGNASFTGNANQLKPIRPVPKARNRARAIARYRIKVRGRRYPEQSTRQEMRGYRRAQGGPGIELVGTRYLDRYVAPF